MNRNKKALTLSVAVGMSAIMGTTPMFVYGAEAVSKDETVYVKTNADGTVENITVSDWLKNADEINGKIKDTTDLKDIKNVKGEEKFKQEGDKVTWDADKKDIYYQGTTDKKLPVDIKITYYLDGNEIAPKDLVGKTGHIKMVVNYKNNVAVKKDINGKEETLYSPFLMVTGMFLPNENYENVTIDNGKIVSDGNRTVVLGMALPGFEESLKLDTKEKEKIDIPSSFTIEADVKNCVINPSYTMAMPDVLDELNLDKIGNLDELKDGINKLKDASVQLLDGTVKLSNGATELNSKYGEFSNGINALNSGANKLNNGANSLESGVNTYVDGAKKLNSGVGAYINGINTLSQKSGEFTNGINALSSGVRQYVDGTNSLASGVEAYVGGTNTLTSKAMEFANGSATLANGAKAYVNGATQLSQGIKEIEGKLSNNSSNNIEQNLLNAGGNAQELGKLLGEAAQTMGQSAMALGGLKDKGTGSINGDALKNNMGQIAQGNQVAIAQLNQLLNTEGIDENLKGQINGVIQTLSNNNASIEGLGSGLAQLSGSISGIQGTVETITNVATNLANGAKKVQETAPTLGNNISNSLNNVGSELKGISSGMEQLKAGIGQLSAGADKLVENNSSLLNGAEAIIAGKEKLQAGVNQLNGTNNENSEKLIGGAKELIKASGKLTDGANKLSNGTKALSDGVNTLVEKGQELANGAEELASKGDLLSNGVLALEKGTLELVNATSKLSDANGKVQEGINALADGANKLKEGQSKFNKEGINKIEEKLGDNLELVLKRLEALQDKDLQYHSFSGKDKDMKGSVKFIIETMGKDADTDNK